MTLGAALAGLLVDDWVAQVLARGENPQVQALAIIERAREAAMADDRAKPVLATADYPVETDPDNLLNAAATTLGLALRLPKSPDRHDVQAMLVNLVNELAARVLAAEAKLEELEE